MAGVLSTAERMSPGDGRVPPAAPDSASEPGGSTRFALPATADIRSVADILGQCRSALEAVGEVVVDCGGVERIDAAVLQCLGALHTSLAEADRPLTFAAPSTAFCRAVEVLGFEPLLGLAAATP